MRRHHTNMYKYNMIRYEIIDRQRKKFQPNYKFLSAKKLGNCTKNFEQITN